MQVKDFLTAMDNILETEDDWGQKNYNETNDLTGKTCYCLLGASNEVSYRLLVKGENRIFEIYDLEINAARVISSLLDNYEDYPNRARIIKFNDDPQTTFADVKALLAKAIKSC